MAQDVIDPWFPTRGNFAPPGDIWQCLETYVVATVREKVLLASSGGAQACG